MSKRKPPSKRIHALRRGRAGIDRQTRATESPKSKDHGEASAAVPSGGHAPHVPPNGRARSHLPSPAAIRETIESVVVAFVLAFLFRTFEAEAFVIPTGSMAPTLMGRHKDLRCPVCDYPYRVSASAEVDPNTQAKRRGHDVQSSTCPMCRYTADVGDGNPQEKTYASFKGDRILVGKFCYQLGNPQRWDVAVFRYPGGAKTNFIKRFVGLPGETIRIYHGDIFVKRDGESDFTVARKPPEKLLATLQPVFDNDYMPQIVEQGWPPRWRPRVWKKDSPGGWQMSNDLRRFETDGSAPGEVWLRYEHLVPSPRDWADQERALALGEATSGRSLKPRLISDFCAYNTSRSAHDRDPYGDYFGLHWVGDLALMCTLQVQSDSGAVAFELVEGGRPMQCRVDVATGMATFTIGGTDSHGLAAKTIDGQEYRLTAQTGIRGPGKYEIIFTNVDDQLRLWVDGRVVRFGASDAATHYAPLNNTRPRPMSMSSGNRASDLSPAGITSKGAALRVSHLKILRDVYYIAKRRHGSSQRYAPPEPFSDFKDIHLPRDILSEPDRWEAFENMREVDFVLGEDQFLALGDNSAKSKDSRLWEQEGFEYFVSRELLIGKALYIYWPHSWNKLPGTGIPFPFFPNFLRMGFVR